MSPRLVNESHVVPWQVEALLMKATPLPVSRLWVRQDQVVATSRRNVAPMTIFAVA